MSLARNKVLYAAILTEFTRDMLCQIHADKLTCKVSSQADMPAIINEIGSTSWRNLFSDINKTWHCIDNAGSDRAAITSLINLYNLFLHNGYYKYICNGLQDCMMNQKSHLTLSQPDAKILNEFLTAKKNFFGFTGIFTIPEDSSQSHQEGHISLSPSMVK
tara:strand:+ start:279 stop:761 length:483 start_codon:yes stop_codon:yes gene_type:complete